MGQATHLCPFLKGNCCWRRSRFSLFGPSVVLLVRRWRWGQMFGLMWSRTQRSASYVSDVNECQLDAALCPRRQACRNTFGSFACVCRDGFVLGTLHRALQCRGEVDTMVTLCANWQLVGSLEDALWQDESCLSGDAHSAVGSWFCFGGDAELSPGLLSERSRSAFFFLPIWPSYEIGGGHSAHLFSSAQIRTNA